MYKNLKSEWLFPIYFWGFLFLKLFYGYINSTLLLASLTLVTLIIFVFKYNLSIIKNSTIFLIILSIFYFFDAFIRINNEIGIRYLNEFLYSGFIPFLLFTQVKNYHLLLKNFSMLGVVSLYVFGFDGIMGYPIFGDYMTFGFNLILPCLFSCMYLLHINSKKIYKLILIPSLLFGLYNALIYSNRGVILAFSVFILFYFQQVNKNNFKKLIFLLPIFLLIYIFSNDIILMVFDYAEKHNISSYSLAQYKIALLGTGDTADFFSGRFDIWKNAYNMISENLIFGNGIGGFERKMGRYSHNFLLDIFIFHGVIGAIIILLLIMKSSINLYKYDWLLFGFIFFLVFPKILLSTYYLKDTFFWVLLSFLYVKKSYSIKGS